MRHSSSLSLSFPLGPRRVELTRLLRDQRVTIESTGQVVKIVGITPDHGMLRTVPVDVDRSGREGGARTKAFVDLQPDGNGFDMLKSLLVAR